MASRLPFIAIGPRLFPGTAATTRLLSLMLVILIAATGCIREEDITLEQRSYQLASQLMCPVCNGQTIDGSNAQIAQDMRAKVQELLESGSTNAEIKDYFVARYGQEILAAPDGSGFNLIAWIVPFFIVFGGIGIAVLTVRNLKRSNARNRASAGSGGDAGRNDLEEYLERVDRDLGIAGGSDSGNPGTQNPKTEKMNPENAGLEEKATS